MRLIDFDYELPAELIAQTPPERRDAARLLVVPPLGPYAHHGFRDLPSLLPDGALLIVNDARVMPARLYARKPTGGHIELLLTTPLAPDGEREVWSCLVRGQKGLAEGTELELLPPRGRTPTGPAPRVIYLGRNGDEGRVAFTAADSLARALEDWGELPLPPYVERTSGPTELDRERYQTVFARTLGAVAAPTAGLHFTEEILAALAARGFERAPVTLHVGPGTFAPVRVDDINEHVMHVERYEVPEQTAAAYHAARAAGRPVVAVGTTVLRTLESALDPDGRLRAEAGTTRLFIRPGHAIRSADLLLTNFHMPRSTLLMLVAAFAGTERLFGAYREAVLSRYRFFSYGDATLLHRARP